MVEGDGLPRTNAHSGRVAEWSKATVLKTVEPARVPWVRIPPLPPIIAKYEQHGAGSSKTVIPFTRYRGFESLSLRHRIADYAD